MKLPVTRGDCKDGPRPCPHACRYRMEGAESCALDVADRGGLSRPEVAAVLGTSKTYIQDTEARAMQKLCDALGVPLPPYVDYALELDDPRGDRGTGERDDATAALLAEHGRSTIVQLAAASGAVPQVIRESLLRLVASDRATRSKIDRVTHAYELTDDAEAAE